MRTEQPRQQELTLPEASLREENTADPDDRTARLAKLKHAIDAGTYRISSDRIADKLIERLRDAPTKT